MAPFTDSGTPPPQSLFVWNLTDILPKCPGIFLGASAIILGVYALVRLQHSRRQERERYQVLAMEHSAGREKHYYTPPSLSDLPPPLQSIVTSSTLAVPFDLYQPQDIFSDPVPPSTWTSGPWRRHSYSSPVDTNSPVAGVASDETSHYPIIDDDGNRQPGLWRRRMLVFEVPPAIHHGHEGLVDIDPESNLSLDRHEDHLATIPT